MTKDIRKAESDNPQQYDWPRAREHPPFLLRQPPPVSGATGPTAELCRGPLFSRAAFLRAENPVPGTKHYRGWGGFSSDRSSLHESLFLELSYGKKKAKQKPPPFESPIQQDRSAQRGSPETTWPKRSPQAVILHVSPLGWVFPGISGLGRELRPGIELQVSSECPHNRTKRGPGFPLWAADWAGGRGRQEQQRRGAPCLLCLGLRRNQTAFLFAGYEELKRLRVLRKSAFKHKAVCFPELQEFRKQVRDCIQKTLTEWSSKMGQDLNQEILEVLECTVAQAIEKINPEERDELKVSAKLFIVGSNSSSIRDAVDMACSALGVAQLDSVIIAPPPIEDGTSLSVEYLQPYWQELENLVENKKIVAIGTSDLDKTLLEQLYLWAQVKPSSNQVNLASCCVMPPDLTAFAKQFDIQLLTHNDPKELLCEASFQEVLQESIQNTKAHEWIPLWLLRYSVIVKSRGIIKSKGYIMQAKRNAS
nr:PREDICTED: glutamate--cysteine ligase regulatory subunit [Opisthocomus hoazin]